MGKLLVFGILILFLVSGVYAATLFESNWDYLGNNFTAISNGGIDLNGDYFDDDGLNCSWTHWNLNSPGGIYGAYHTILSGIGDAPGDRNFDRVVLGLRSRCGGNSDLVTKSGASMGNPPDVYFRIWFRLSPDIPDGTQSHVGYFTPNYDDITHDVIINGYNCGIPTYCGPSVLHFRNSPTGGGLSVGILVDEGIYLVTGSNIPTKGVWHLWEVHFHHPPEDISGTRSGSVECRLDGVDVTPSMREANSNVLLSSINGHLTFAAMNYMYWQFYPTGSCQPDGQYSYDLAAIKFTDGPSWIGGDESSQAHEADTNSNGCVDQT